MKYARIFPQLCTHTPRLKTLLHTGDGFNAAAQMLTASGNKLFYNTFPDQNKHFYEIDFILSRAQKICPIEVKSSGYKTHKSLDLFCEKYSDRIRDRYLMYPKDLSKDSACLSPAPQYNDLTRRNAARFNRVSSVLMKPYIDAK